MRFFAIAFVALILVGCGKKEEPPVRPSAEDATLRITTTGPVIGFTGLSGAHNWRGVPFAASTTGDNRWRAPRPAPSWEAPREAIDFGERCAQLVNPFSEGEGFELGEIIGSEDCLTVDVYAPEGALEAEQKLPVMVWIHGGGNVWGRSSSYDGSTLAVNENVIIIAVQYRLGPLGWFSDQALRDSAELPEDASANYGTLDLVSALKWVRENAAAFGGDPQNVTIFGESAGGHNVVTLLASPLAKGLFHKAIIQSGSFDSVSIAVAEGASGEEANPSSEIIERLGGGSADALRRVSVQALHDAYELDGGGYLSLPRIIEDGIALPATSLREAFSSTDTFNPVPIITGTNRDEMKLFNMLDPRASKRLFGLFPVARNKKLYDAMSDYPSRVWRIRSVDEPAAMMAGVGHNDVYAYRFDWDEGGRLMFSDMSKMLGAAHGMEIPFVFNHFVLFGRLDPILFKKKTLVSREALASAMGAYWAEFARTGAPSDGGENLTAWPRWSEEGGSLMRLDSGNDGGLEVITGRDSLEALSEDLKIDPRLDAKGRCLVVKGVGEWLPELGGELALSMGCSS